MGKGNKEQDRTGGTVSGIKASYLIAFSGNLAESMLIEWHTDFAPSMCQQSCMQQAPVTSALAWRRPLSGH